MLSDEAVQDDHLPSSELVRLVAAGASHPHLDSCELCRDRRKVLSWSGEEMRALVSFAVRKKRRDARPSPAGIISALARARELAAEIVAAAEIDETDADLVLLAHRNDPILVMGVLHACQRASRLAAKHPAKADAFGIMVREWAKCREDVIAPADVVGVRLEALFVRIAAALQQGRTEDALTLAEKALVIATEKQDHELIRARALYFHACSLSAKGETDRAVAELERSIVTFREFSLPSWEGKAIAAIGLALFQRKASEQALERLDAGLALLDPDEDAHNIAAVLTNRGALLDMLKRRSEAREAYRRALEASTKAGLTSLALASRVNLLGFALDDGAFREVLERGPRLLELIEEEGLADLVFYAHLFLAEAHFAVGSRRAGDEHLVRAQGGIPAALVGDTELETILSRMDAGNADAFERSAFVRRVRHYLERGSDEAQESA